MKEDEQRIAGPKSHILSQIDTLIEIIDGQRPETDLPKIPTRDEIIGLHYAFIKSFFLLTEKEA